jgi:biotin carboxyl carrier protein
MKVSFWSDNQEYILNLKEKSGGCVTASLNGKEYPVYFSVINEDEILLNIGGKIYNTLIDSNSSAYLVYLNGKSYRWEKKSASKILKEHKPKLSRKDINTSMPGRVIRILLKEGETVKEGQPVLILEAMKMQNEIKSPQSGRLIRVRPKEGDSVEAGSLLFTVG